MSVGLYSGVSGLALGTGLYKNVSGLWSGASGLIDGFGGGSPFGGASLYLDFLAGAPLDSRVTFSRGTNATLVDSTGKIVYAPANLLLQSQTFDNASWGKTSTTVTADATTAPDGTLTADKLISNNGVAISATNITQTITAATATYTYSIYAKKAEFNRVNLVVRDDASAGNNAQVTVSLEDGSVTAAATAGGTFTGASANVSSAANGFYRVALTFTSTGATALRVRVFPNDSVATTGDGTSGIFLWGAQVEPVTYQTTPSTYNVTTSAAYYGPRFDYDPVTLAPKGLLIEEQRVNLMLYSQQFDNASWTKGDATVTANATTAPDGTATADLLTETATSNFHFVFQAATTAAGAATATVYAKLSSGSRNLAVYPQGTTIGWAIFNLATGVITTSGGGALLSSSITAVGNGWYRCSVTWTASAVSSNFVCYLTNSTTVPNASYLGDGTSGIFLYGAQLEAGSFATSYIPTVASQVTRNADIATMTGTNFSSWYNQTEGTIVASVDTVASTGSPILSFQGAPLSSVNRHQMNVYTACTATVVGGVTQSNIGINTSAAVNLAYAYKANDFAVSANGGAVAVDNSGTVPTTLAYATLGKWDYGTAASLNGHIRQIAYYNTRLPNSQLQELTAPSLAITLNLDFINGVYDA